MAERYASGVLDTCTYIDLDVLDPTALPVVPEITAVTMAELRHGVAVARDAKSRSARAEKLGIAIADFDPLPFDGVAAARYGTLVELVLAKGRNPRPRRLDLMIASIASAEDLPLFTRNPKDFAGTEEIVTIISV